MDRKSADFRRALRRERNGPPRDCAAGRGVSGTGLRRGLRDYSTAGSSTVSMTWITPFDCFTSAMVTVAVRS